MTDVPYDWDWHDLDGDMWASLLSMRPEKAEYCDWAKLSSVNWRDLLHFQPKFAEHCGTWSCVSGEDINRCLKSDRDLVAKTGLKGVSKDALSRAVGIDPSHARLFKDLGIAIDSLTSSQLRNIWEQHPDVLIKCEFTNWSVFEAKDFLEFLLLHPSFITVAARDNFKKLSSEQLILLFSKHMKNTHSFSSDEWGIVLGEYASYKDSERVNILNALRSILSIGEWLTLISGYNVSYETSREIVAAIVRESFKQADMGKLIAVSTHNRALRERICWDDFEDEIRAYNWVGMADDERSAFAENIRGTHEKIYKIIAGVSNKDK